MFFLEFLGVMWAMVAGLGIFLLLVFITIEALSEKPSRSDLMEMIKTIPLLLFAPVTVLVVMGWAFYRTYHVIRYEQAPSLNIWERYYG